MKKTSKQFEDKTTAVLEKEAADLKKEIGKMIIEAKSNPQKDSNALMKKRRTLAVLLTVLSRKQLISKVAQVKS